MDLFVTRRAGTENAIAGFRIRAQAPFPECRTTTNDR